MAIETTAELSLTPTPSLTPFLPSGAMIRQKLADRKEMRTALIEYVRAELHEGKHFYYMSALASKTRTADEKPALSQDGARNICGLYDVYADTLQIEEIALDNGHMRFRAHVALKSYDDTIRAVGIGTCSTRETRYAYRWVFDNRVPKHLDKRTLRTETRGQYTVYRVDNEDLEDSVNTVTKMAIKRGVTAAVFFLPGISEVFEASAEEDPDGTGQDSERLKQAMVTEIYALLEAIKRGRSKAAQQVFGVGIQQIKTLDVDAVRVGLGRLRAAQEAGHDWEHGDLQATEQQHAAKTRADLFGGEPAQETTPPQPTSGPNPQAWRDTLHGQQVQLPEHHAARAKFVAAIADPAVSTEQGEAFVTEARALVLEEYRKAEEAPRKESKLL